MMTTDRGSEKRDAVPLAELAPHVLEHVTGGAAGYTYDGISHWYTEDGERRYNVPGHGYV